MFQVAPRQVVATQGAPRFPVQILEVGIKHHGNDAVFATGYNPTTGRCAPGRFIIEVSKLVAWSA